MPLFLPLTSVPRRVAVVETLQGGVAEKPLQLAPRFLVPAGLLALLQRLVPHAGKPVEGLLEEGWRWLHWDGSSWTAQPAATAGGAQ